MSPLEAVRIAKQDGFDDHLQSIILATGDAEYAYRFAHEVPGADLDALETVVLKSGDFRIVYDFAVLKSGLGGDIDQLQDRMLGCGDGGLMLLFAVDVAGADLDLFDEALRELPDPKFFRLFEAEKREKGID